MAPFILLHGPMFAGKTKSLFRHVQQSGFLPEEILLVKHAIDTRYQHDYIISHDGERQECSPIRLSLEILYLINDKIKLVAIDEVQFFDDKIINVIQELIIKNIEVIASGLFFDSKHLPFGPMPELKKLATQELIIIGICQNCGKEGTHTYRKNNTDMLVMVGGADLYECRCAICYEIR